MERAVETAYKAVMKPKEGTILTVAKEAALKAAEIAPEAEELESTTAKEFIDFLITDDAKTIFRKYYFDTDVEN